MRNFIKGIKLRLVLPVITEIYNLEKLLDVIIFPRPGQAKIEINPANYL